MAYRFAVEVRDAPPDGLAGAFWLSAKRRRFAGGEIQALRSPDFVDLESAVNRLLVNYGFSELLDDDLTTKQDVLLELLEALPVLIILDDLDSVQTEDEDVVEFFSLRVAMTASKVLMTSRRDFAGMGSTKTVVGGLDGVLTLRTLDDAVERMGGHPSLVDFVEANTLSELTTRILADR